MGYLIDFLDYYPKVRARTTALMEVIPADKVDWAYAPGKFTIGDILRHIALVERNMYAETICDRPSLYSSHNKSLAPQLSDIIRFMDTLHSESMGIFSNLTENEMLQKCTTPAGVKITKWKWLRAMVEHEIHHRGQLYIYLNILNIQTPPMYKLSAEELMALSKK